jgi:hypothetical protein
LAGSANFVFDGTNVGIGIASPTTKLDIRVTTNPANDNGTGANTLKVYTNVSQSADVGGAIGLGGYYNATPESASFGQIAGRKENSTANNLSGYLQFSTLGSAGTMTEKLRITSSGNVGIGNSNPSYKLDVNGVIRSAPTSGAADFIASSNSINWEYGVGTDGVGFIYSGQSSMLVFSSNATERMRLPTTGGLQVVTSISVGNAAPTTSGAGITFPVTQNASSNANTLDDYEEGEVTIQYADAASGGNAYNVSARFIKIGKMVFMNWSAYYQSTPTWTAGNDIFVRGLPFVTNFEGSAGAIMLRYSGSNGTAVYLWQPNGQTYFVLKNMDFDNGVKGSNMPTSLTTYANICYLAAN